MQTLGGGISQEQRKLCVLDYLQVLSNSDVESCAATFAEDCANHDPVGAPPNIGYAALRQYFSGMGKNGSPVQFGGLDVFELNAADKIKILWGFWDPAPLFAALVYAIEQAAPRRQIYDVERIRHLQ